MTQHTKNVTLFILALLSVPACMYPFYQGTQVLQQVKAGSIEVHFDTGAFYLTFASLFITLCAGEFFGLRSRGGFIERNAGAILISNFIAVAILAPALSFGMVHYLESSDYKKCDDPAEISRVSRGQSYIFKLGGCENLPAP